MLSLKIPSPHTEIRPAQGCQSDTLTGSAAYGKRFLLTPLHSLCPFLTSEYEIHVNVPPESPHTPT